MFDVFIESSRILFSNESITEETNQAQTTYDELSPLQLTDVWFPRVVGFIVTISALSIMNVAWRQRDYMFHRLVLVMGIHQVIYGLVYVIGTIAIPREYDEFYGNFGTIGTCTAQGFLLYVSIRSSAIYYGFFSVYSYIAVLNDFDKKKYGWCEKWIHIFVHSYTILTGIYVLTIQGFNPDLGFCKMGSYPPNCDTTEGQACERGPDSFTPLKAFIIWISPLTFFLIIPTVLMATLYYKVKKREAQEDSGKLCLVTSKDVAIQSCAYLFALYWTILPFFVLISLNLLCNINHDILTPYMTAATINYGLFAFWTMLAYWYFSIERPEHGRLIPSHNNNTEGSAGRRKTRQTQLIFNMGSSQIIEGSASKRSVVTDTQTTRTLEQVEPEPPAEKRFSFNIFDGTNASGGYADFIHDGDSEDERLELEETNLWEAVQDHI